MENQNRPKVLEPTQEQLEYLDELRESGVTNMFGAGAYVEEEFGADPKTAREIVGYWMRTFSDRHREAK